MLQCDSLDDSYNKIKQAIYKHVTTYEQLEALKNCFARQIQSPRRLKFATTIELFIDLLERRGILTKTNISCLQDVAILLNYTGFNAVFSSYMRKITQCDDDYNLENQYVIQRLNRLSLYEEEYQKKKLEEVIEFKPKFHNTYDKTTFSDNKKKKIYDLIATEIGKKWRELGRELKIKEGELDEIDEKFRNNTKSKVYEIFRLYEERTDVNKIIILLLEALEMARRKDLKRSVEEILTRSQ